ncbi:MAG: ester cyclase [Acidimicrobiia bacterium]
MPSTTNDRAQIVMRAIEATVSGDTSAVDELFTADVVAWSPTVAVSSRVELAVEIEDHEEAFSEIEVGAGAVVASGDHVCAEWVATATHSGPLDLYRGSIIRPTGRRVTLRGVTVADFEGDLICAVRHYWDEIELLSELGLLPGG